MDLLHEIKRLTAERGTLLARIRDIDLQLGAVRDVLSPRAVVNAAIRAEIKPRQKNTPGAISLTRQAILDALAKEEPQSAQMMKERLAYLQVTTVPQTLSAMKREGLLSGVRRVGYTGIWYSRATKQTTEAVSDDELGPSPENGESEDSISSDTVGNLS